MDARIEIFAVTLGAAPSERQQELAYRRILRHDPCSYCEAPSRDADHIRSTRLDGEDAWTNLTAACGRCNRRKNTRTVLAFMIHQPIGDDHRVLEARRRAESRRRRAA